MLEKKCLSYVERVTLGANVSGADLMRAARRTDWNFVDQFRCEHVPVHHALQQLNLFLGWWGVIPQNGFNLRVSDFVGGKNGG
jgi:hypothetical protein